MWYYVCFLLRNVWYCLILLLLCLSGFNFASSGNAHLSESNPPYETLFFWIILDQFGTSSSIPAFKRLSPASHVCHELSPEEKAAAGQKSRGCCRWRVSSCRKAELFCATVCLIRWKVGSCPCCKRNRSSVRGIFHLKISHGTGTYGPCDVDWCPLHCWCFKEPMIRFKGQHRSPLKFRSQRSWDAKPSVPSSVEMCQFSPHLIQKKDQTRSSCFLNCRTAELQSHSWRLRESEKVAERESLWFGS